MNLTSTDTLLLQFFVLLLMLGMGASLTTANFLYIVRKPTPILIGFACQYGLMPLSALALVTVLGLPPEIAVGLMVLGCTCGGPLSNFSAYLARGDVALSVSLTTLSLMTAFIMVPLCMMIYAGHILDSVGGQALRVPYDTLSASLLAMLVPIGLGMLLRRWNARWAGIVERVGSLAGMAVFAFLVLKILIREIDFLLQLPPTVFVASTILAPTGFVMASLLVMKLRLEPMQRRTMILEAGVQNGPLAVAIILITFPPEIQAFALIPPTIYGASVPIVAIGVALMMRKLAMPSISLGTRDQPS